MFLLLCTSIHSSLTLFSFFSLSFLFFSFVLFSFNSIPCSSSIPFPIYFPIYLVYYKATDRKLKKEKTKKKKNNHLDSCLHSQSQRLLTLCGDLPMEAPAGRSVPAPPDQSKTAGCGAPGTFGGSFVHLCAGIVTLRYGTASLIIVQVESVSTTE